jgi:hypothetical protein
MHDVTWKLGDGSMVTTTVDELRGLLPELLKAPGGKEGSPSAHRAHELLASVIERADEVRHWEFEEPMTTEVLWALERVLLRHETLSDGLLELRHHLSDEAQRVQG